MIKELVDVENSVVNCGSEVEVEEGMRGLIVMEKYELKENLKMLFFIK